MGVGFFLSPSILLLYYSFRSRSSTIRLSPCSLLARCAVPFAISFFPDGGYFDFTPILQSFVAIRYYGLYFYLRRHKRIVPVWEALSVPSFPFPFLSFPFFFSLSSINWDTSSRFLFSVICFFPPFALTLRVAYLLSLVLFSILWFNPLVFSLSTQTSGFRLSVCLC